MRGDAVVDGTLQGADVKFDLGVLDAPELAGVACCERTAAARCFDGVEGAIHQLAEPEREERLG